LKDHSSAPDARRVGDRQSRALYPAYVPGQP